MSNVGPGTSVTVYAKVIAQNPKSQSCCFVISTGLTHKPNDADTFWLLLGDGTFSPSSVQNWQQQNNCRVLVTTLSCAADVLCLFSAGRGWVFSSFCTYKTFNAKSTLVPIKHSATSSALRQVIYGFFSELPQNISSPDRSETVLSGWLKQNVIEINGDYSWEMNMSLKLRDEWWPGAVGDCYTEVDKSLCRDLAPVTLHKQQCHDKQPKQDISSSQLPRS